MKNKLLITLIAFSISLAMNAYTYQEHKEIGDIAFKQFVDKLKSTNRLSLLFAYLDISPSNDSGNYYFKALMLDYSHLISYGVLNGLSGDHSQNPLELEEELRHRTSVIQRIISLQNEYLEKNYTGASDIKVVNLDFRYLLLAAIGLAHFHDYGRPFDEQLRFFNKKTVEGLQNPSLVKAIFRKLDKTNSINMYTTLHVLAMDLAHQAGVISKKQPEKTKLLLHYAFLFNSFADHFLEDCFCSGHLVVNRDIIGSLTNNKALHDFYNEKGCMVVNRNGEQWKAYGDNDFNSTHSKWMQRSSLFDVTYDEYTLEAKRTISAVNHSINEVWDSFIESYCDITHPSFLDLLPEEKKGQSIYLIEHIIPLSYIPIPFNTNLVRIMPDSIVVTQGMQDAVDLLYYRNFCRARISNSFIFGYSTIKTKGFYPVFDFRINVGKPISVFNYNAEGGKKGTVDYWMGYTFVYSLTHARNLNNDGSMVHAQQIRLGLRNNLDFWVAEQRFLGLFNYTEAGIQFSQKHSQFVFVPAIGVQFGSLFKINYYNLPTWSRLPLQFLLPLSFKYSVVMSPHRRPVHMTGVDLNVLF